LSSHKLSHTGQEKLTGETNFTMSKRREFVEEPFDFFSIQTGGINQMINEL